ncbi:hypothetical protein FACS1894159_05560 [Bacteroidia bacterium]|nr:hypothetical protein FACS1894159_05560 [Bacteroidia bacterium]
MKIFLLFGSFFEQTTNGHARAAKKESVRVNASENDRLEPEAFVLIEAEHNVQVLDRLAAGSFEQVVDDA